MGETARHFLDLEPLLIARLQEQLPDGVEVQPEADVAAGGKSGGTKPRVQVIYDGYQAGTGPMIEISQRWLTVIVVRNVAQVSSGQAARKQAGPLASTVIEALHRWRPPGYTLMTLTSSPYAPGYEGGRIHLPLAWQTTRKEIAPNEQ